MTPTNFDQKILDNRHCIHLNNAKNKLLKGTSLFCKNWTCLFLSEDFSHFYKIKSIVFSVSLKYCVYLDLALLSVCTDTCTSLHVMS